MVGLSKHMLLKKKGLYFPIIAIVISSSVHLWNPTGFPTIHIDEGIYMLRAMHVLNGFGLKDDASSYDHPFFGPIFLAGFLSMIDYPANASIDIRDTYSSELLYLYPRILMGILATLDTFLIYMIGKIRYNKNVGFLAAILFAIMPLTWPIRRIYLESILLPFLLSSILFSVYINSYDNRLKKSNLLDIINSKNNQLTRKFTNKHIFILISGICLGITIFTKIPMITMIPVMLFLTYRNDKNIRDVAILLIPLILIPFLWPLYATYNGEFDKWLNGIVSQISRSNNYTIWDFFSESFLIDPMLLTLGIGGTVFAIVKKDFFLILWTIPMVIFFGFVIDYVNWFHWIPILGSISISSAVLIENMLKKMAKQRMLMVGLITSIVLIGTISTIIVVSTNVSSFQFQSVNYVSKILTNHTNSNYSNITYPSVSKDIQRHNYMDENNAGINYNDNRGKYTNDSVTIISSPIYSWIFKYVYNYTNTFSSYTEQQDIRTNKVILIMDRYFRGFLLQNAVDDRYKNDNMTSSSADIFEIFAKSGKKAYFKGTAIDYNLNQYPFTIMKYNFGGSPVEIRANFDS